MTAANTLSAFGRLGGGEGADVSFRSIQSMKFRAFGRFNQWAVEAVRFQPIQPVGGAHVCKLLLQGSGGGGGGGAIQSRSRPQKGKWTDPNIGNLALRLLKTMKHEAMYA